MIVCDIEGALYAGRPGLDSVREALAARTNPSAERGMADDVLAGADVLVGVSGPRAVSEAAVRRMAPRPVVFAMANPEPEVRVEAVGGDVAIMATGRSDSAEANAGKRSDLMAGPAQALAQRLRSGS